MLLRRTEEEGSGRRHDRGLLTHHRITDALAIDVHARIHWVERRYGQARFETICRQRFNPPLNEGCVFFATTQS